MVSRGMAAACPGAGWVVIVLAAAPVWAQQAFLSEFFFEGHPDSSTPDAVEVHALGSFDALDLVIFDARPAFYGQVLSVHTLPDVGSALLVSESNWPSPWSPQPPSDRITTLEQLGSAGSFDFNGARGVLLYDRDTGLLANRVNLFTDPLQQAKAADATLLDAVTLDADGSAMAFEGYPVIAMDHGSAAVRMIDWTGDGPGGWQVGVLNGLGMLANTAPPLPVTPGWSNPPYTPPPAGDINGDGVVDLGDYDILSTHYGSAGPGIGRGQGDLDDDGDVDFEDFVELALNMRPATQDPPAAVPEPGTLTWALGAVVIFVLPGGRRHGAGGCRRGR